MGVLLGGLFALARRAAVVAPAPDDGIADLPAASTRVVLVPLRPLGGGLVAWLRRRSSTGGRDLEGTLLEHA